MTTQNWQLTPEQEEITCLTLCISDMKIILGCLYL